MLNIERALWYIELELGSDLDLGRVARHCNLSPFALARLFSLSTGWPVMRYPGSAFEPGGANLAAGNT